MTPRLFGSVSIIGLCVGTAAFANGGEQTVVVPGAELPADYAFEAGENVRTGVVSTGASNSTAIVEDVPSGTFVQHVSNEEHPAVAPAALAPPGPDIHLFLRNDTSLAILAGAAATPDGGLSADAHAQVTDAISQIATGPNTNIDTTFVNSGDLLIGADAKVSGSATVGDVTAGAQASLIGGVHQEATVEGGGGGTATVVGSNDGTYQAYADAQAAADGDANAVSTLQEAIFMRAQANGAGDGTTLTVFSNNGGLEFRSSADSSSTDGDASSTASAGGGEHGLIHIRGAANGVGQDSATVIFEMSDGATLDVSADADAQAALLAEAEAITDGALVMRAQANGQDDGDVVLAMDNQGDLMIAARASATSTLLEGTANAQASMSSAIVQTAETGGPDSYVGRSGLDRIENGGTITISGSSIAQAVGSANASTLIRSAILQEAENTGYAETIFSNAGSVWVAGDASAAGLNADAVALGTGVEQEIFGLGVSGVGLAGFSNAGDLSVVMSAVAAATGGPAVAEADATGYRVWGEPLYLDVANRGNLVVQADAQANGTASANATGLTFLATWDPTVELPEDEEGHGHGGGAGEHGNGHGGGDEGPIVWEDAATNAISGKIFNGGAIQVSAIASGSSSPSAWITSTQVADASASQAVATAVYLEGAVIDATFGNSGIISAQAATDNGDSQAYGILVRDFTASPIEPGPNDVFTIVNQGGSIIARRSFDLGESWSHGLAIDTTLAPNPVDIRFGGASHVYGDIDISADDAITVTDGRFALDGLINPHGELEGGLFVRSGATLYLTDTINTNPDYDGPAGGSVRVFAIEPNGTLALQLPVSEFSNLTPAGAKQAASLSPQGIGGSYPQIFADQALLGGNLVLVLSTPNGLYDDAYFWDNVIDANALDGTFSNVVTSTGSILLNPTAIYDTAANVDLLLVRVPFDDSRFGLTPNQSAAAGGIESVYSPTLTGAFADMVAEMFTLPDASSYAGALSTLHGAQYATYLTSLGWMGSRFNGILSDMGECASLQLEDSTLSCRRENSMGVWGTVNYGSERIDSDLAADATGYSSDQWLAAVGVDFTVGDAAVLGIGAGYVKNKGDFDWFGGTMNSDGFQIGAYGAYDPGTFYVKGAVSYTDLSGDSFRTTQVGSIAGTASAKVDSNIWAVGGEAGYRFALTGATVTPYAGLDYVSAKLKGFTETGTSAGILSVNDSKENYATSELGLKLAGNFGSVVPELKAGWRHAFKFDPAAFTASYALETGSTFSVIAPHLSPDVLVARFDLAARLSDRMKVRLGYEGEFGGKRKVNAVFGSLVMRLGGQDLAPSAALLAEPRQLAAINSLLKLNVDVSGVYDDNIFATRNGKVDDFIALFRPSARIQVGDRATYLEFGGRGELARNSEHETENYSDWTVDWDSRLRLSDEASVILNGDYSWTHEARTSPEAVFGLAPTRYQRGYGVAGLLLHEGDWFARIAASGTTYNFDDTAAASGIIDNDDRDRTETDFVGRVGYSIADATDFFVQVTLGDTHYTNAIDNFGYNRNSKGLGAVAGLRRGKKDGLNAEVFAGILHQSYDDPALQDLKTFDIGMLINWVGDRSDASFRVDRGVGATTLPGASAYVHTNGSVSFSAAAGPRLSAGITLRGTQYDYVGNSRKEFIINSDVWTRYWFASHFYAGLAYDFTQRASNVAGYNYDENRFMLSLGAQLQPRYLDAQPLSLSGAEQAPGGLYAAILMGHGTLASGVAGPRDVHDFNTADFGNYGAAYGAAAGYGVTFDPVYLGVEIAATTDGPSWRHDGSRTFSVDKNGALELAARAGFVTAHRALVYGRFGFVSADFTTDYASGAESADLRGRKSGMSVGFGIEAPAGNRAFLRAEYVVNSYRDYDVALANGARDNFSNAEGQFRLGAGIRFGDSAEATAPPADFAGPYVGLFAGHGALTTRTAGLRGDQPPLDATRSSHGGLLGAFAGYGFVAGGFYVGAEVQGDVSNIDWNSQGGADGRTYSSRHQYSFGAGAKLGRLIGPSALVYGRAGAVVTRFDTEYEFAGVAVSSNKSLTGLQLGGGLEIVLSSKIRLRAEYALIKYNNYNIEYYSSSENFDHNENIFNTGVLFSI